MKQKLFTLLTLLVLCVTGAWADDVNTTLIDGISLPSLPSGTYTGGTEVIHKSTYKAVVLDDDNNGIMEASAPGYNSPTAANFTWANAATSGTDGNWSTTGASWNAPSGSIFVGSSAYNNSSNVHNLNFSPRKCNIRTDRTFAYRFTNCAGVSVLVKSQGKTESAAAILAVYKIGEGSTLTFVGKASSVKNSQEVITVDGLNTSDTYVAYIYGANGSNGEFDEIAFLAPSSAVEYTISVSVDDAEHGSAEATASKVKEGNSVTFTATENLGWKFTKWTNTSTGDDVSTDNPYTIASVSGDVNLTANYEAVTTYNVTISAGETGALGNYCDNKVITQNENTTVTLPAKNSWFYKEGYTATGWTDGTNDYAFGGTFTLTGNVTIYPKFRANTKAIGDANATVTWNLTKPVSGPLHIEGTTGYFVTTAEVGGETIDVPMYWDNTSGKLDNRSRDTNNDCQVNNGSKFTIPAVKGMTVTLAASYAITATIDGSDMTATTASPFTATGTYTGTEDDVEVVINGGSWFQSITATYKVGYDAPTIEKSDVFNFEHKGFPVTITAAEGTLNVSTDGTNYEAQVSPYVTYATATTTYYAKVTGADYNDSEVASLEVVNSYDASKKYVAYVYQKGYSDSSVDYDFATDELAIGLAADYNVVPVELAQADDPTAKTDMDKADLIVLTEAVKGSNTATDLSNKMKEYVGVTPMIGMKVFAYTYNTDASKNRWGWGNAANNSGKNAFMPKDNTYKIFEGVVFEADGSIKLATTTSGNIIQSVDFTTPATPLSPNTIMGTVGNDDKKAVIHTTTKYLGLGISCNVRESYTPNLIAIVKNAAAILIANGDLTAKADFAKKVTGTITVSGWNSFSSVFPLDLNTITATNEVAAYYASKAAGSFVTMTETDATVPAGEGLMIKGTAGDDFTIDVATADADFTGTNLLVGLPNGGKVTKDDNNYVFAWPTATPADCGFYLIDDVEPTLPAGKAYLHTSTALTSRELSISFDAGTTGINAIDNGQLTIDTNAPMYNLAGQRVNKSYKGVVIVNGKKMLNK